MPSLILSNNYVQSDEGLGSAAKSQIKMTLGRIFFRRAKYPMVSQWYLRLAHRKFLAPSNVKASDSMNIENTRSSDLCTVPRIEDVFISADTQQTLFKLCQTLKYTVATLCLLWNGRRRNNSRRSSKPAAVDMS